MADLLPVVIHPRHPPGVPEAIASVPGVDSVAPGASELADVVRDAVIYLTWVWDDGLELPNLKWIQSISAGVDQFPLDVLAQRGVVLTSASGLHAVPVTEHAFALLLALTRGVGAAMRNTVDRRWRPHMNYEITTRTMLVLGLGAIGEEIARRASAWGMTVIGLKRDPSGYGGAASEVYPSDRLVEAATRADVIVSVLPDSPETRGLVDRSVLEALGEGWFVNVGRGSVVSEADLVWALDEGSLRGAGLDVFEEEPLPDGSALWGHPRVVITPHTAGLSPMYGPRLAEIFGANLRAFKGEGPWINRIV